MCHSARARTSTNTLVLETEVRLLAFLSWIIRLDSWPAHDICFQRLLAEIEEISEGLSLWNLPFRHWV